MTVALSTVSEGYRQSMIPVRDADRVRAEWVLDNKVDVTFRGPDGEVVIQFDPKDSPAAYRQIVGLRDWLTQVIEDGLAEVAGVTRCEECGEVGVFGHICTVCGYVVPVDAR